MCTVIRECGLRQSILIFFVFLFQLSCSVLSITYSKLAVPSGDYINIPSTLPPYHLTKITNDSLIKIRTSSFFLFLYSCFSLVGAVINLFYVGAFLNSQ